MLAYGYTSVYPYAMILYFHPVSTSGALCHCGVVEHIRLPHTREGTDGKVVSDDAVLRDVLLREHRSQRP
ncbi:hypothetical protein D3C71_2015870 [compost metagenome]